LNRRQLGKVAYTYNLNFLGSGDQEDHSSRPVQGKSYHDPISTNKSSVVVPACDPSCEGGIGRRIIVPGQLGQKLETFPEKKLKQKKGWMCDSSGRTPV
jgi:hypothetical protein